MSRTIRDARQADLFAAPPPSARDQQDPNAYMAETHPAPRSETDPAKLNEEATARLAARRQEWDDERTAIEAAQESNTPEVLTWGKKVRGCSGKYLELALLRDGDRWRVRRDYSMPNMGGGGPFGPARYASRDEALIDTLRDELNRIARHLASSIHSSVNYGTEADWRSMAAWCVAQGPSALFGGPDLQREFEELCAVYEQREALRCAAIRAGAQSYVGEDGEERTIYSL